MLSFEQFKKEDGSPIYQQILRYVQRGIVAGTIQKGEEMPSRRMLSALLGINPNTVQKAYQLLAEHQLIENHGGAKSYTSFTEETVMELRKELLSSEIKVMIEAMKQAGLTKEQMIELIETYWGGDD